MFDPFEKLEADHNNRMFRLDPHRGEPATRTILRAAALEVMYELEVDQVTVDEVVAALLDANPNAHELPEDELRDALEDATVVASMRPMDVPFPTVFYAGTGAADDLCDQCGEPATHSFDVGGGYGSICRQCAARAVRDGVARFGE